MNAQVQRQRPVQGYDGSFYGVGDKVEIAPKLERTGFGRVVELIAEDRVRVVLDDEPQKTYAIPTDKLRRVLEH